MRGLVFAVCLLTAVVLMLPIAVRAADGMSGFSPHVDAAGNITLPSNFRMTMVHLGSWFVPEGEASGFHDVYTDLGTVEVYRRTGEFPDGATLVKELRGSQAGDYTTGRGVSRATADIKQWFVMVKDTRGRFPDNPLWGDGWGWALFQSGSGGEKGGRKNAAGDYRSDCLGCHVPARGTEWVYVQGYPTLQSD